MGCSCTKPANTATGSGKNKRRSDVRDYYRIGGVLGSGSFGQVRTCLKKSTNESFAVKIMAKDPPKERRGSNNVDFTVMFRNEVSILTSLSHPHIIKIMEKCEGGELFSHIVKRRRFAEREAALLTYQMLQAIRYVHSCNVIHRDVKAENFLFSDRSPNTRLILIDFGMSIKVTENERNLKQLCGSPHYVAPELVRRNYKFKVDMWALGVVVYLMLFGRYPFEGSDQKAIVQAILSGKPDFTVAGSHTTRSSQQNNANSGASSQQPSSSVGASTRGSSLPPPSDLALDFITALLEKDPDQRLSPDEALEHCWIKSNCSTCDCPNGCETRTRSIHRRISSSGAALGSRRHSQNFDKLKSERIRRRSSDASESPHSPRQSMKQRSLSHGNEEETEPVLHRRRTYRQNASGRIPENSQRRSNRSEASSSRRDEFNHLTNDLVVRS